MGYMEKQETDADTKSGNRHGKWKILHALTTGKPRLMA